MAKNTASRVSSSAATGPLTAAELLKMPASAYMNSVQQAFFRQQLLDLKSRTAEHMETIKQEIATPSAEADALDRALWEDDNRQRMRIAEREYFLMCKIDKALDRIERGEYGYCEASGIEIGLERLLARPTTEFCAEEKARQEELERNFSKSRH